MLMILMTSQVRDRFMSFCRAQHCVEKVLFMCDVLEFQAGEDGPATAEKCRAIVQQ
jgi:hypothetical protein